MIRISLFVQKLLRRGHFQVIKVLYCTAIVFQANHGVVAKGRVSLVALAALEGIKFVLDGYGVKFHNYWFT